MSLLNHDLANQEHRWQAVLKLEELTRQAKAHYGWLALKRLPPHELRRRVTHYHACAEALDLAQLLYDLDVSFERQAWLGSRLEDVVTGLTPYPLLGLLQEDLESLLVN